MDVDIDARADLIFDNRFSQKLNHHLSNIGKKYYSRQ